MIDGISRVSVLHVQIQLYLTYLLEQRKK